MRGDASDGCARWWGREAVNVDSFLFKTAGAAARRPRLRVAAKLFPHMS